MLEIEVMYADLSRRRATIEETNTLPREGVLFIVLSTEWGNRKALRRRIWGFDYYGLWIDHRSWMLEGWDNGDLYWRQWSLRYPDQPYKSRKRPMPMPRNTLIFRGKGLSQEDWKQALEVFDEEMF